MINMKVIRVKAKVASKACTEEHLRNELIFANQENERLRDKLATEKKKASEAYDLAIKASADLATRLIKVMDERDDAIEESADLCAELMEREFRIDELTRRIKWLEAQLPQKTTEIVS
jgi:hypothetical protein